MTSPSIGRKQRELLRVRFPAWKWPGSFPYPCPASLKLTGWAEEVSVISGDDPLVRARVQLPIRTSSLVQPRADVVQQSGFPAASGRTVVQLHSSAPRSGIPIRQRTMPQVHVSAGSSPARSSNPHRGACRVGVSTPRHFLTRRSGRVTQGSLVTLVRLQPPTPAPTTHFIFER